MTGEKNASRGHAPQQRRTVDKSAVGFKVVDQNKRVLFKDKQPVNDIDSAEDVVRRYNFIKTAYMNWKGEDLPYIYDVFSILAGTARNAVHVQYTIPAWLSELLKNGQGGWELGVEDAQGNVHLLDKNLRQLRDLGGHTLVLYYSKATADHGEAATAEQAHEGTVRLEEAVLDTIVFTMEQERGRDGYGSIPLYRSAFVPITFRPEHFDGLSPEVMAFSQNLSRRRKKIEPPAPHRRLEGVDAVAAATLVPEIGGYWVGGMRAGGPVREMPSRELEGGHVMRAGLANRQPEANAVRVAEGIWNSSQKRHSQNLPVANTLSMVIAEKSMSSVAADMKVASRTPVPSWIANPSFVFSRMAAVQAETIRGAVALARIERTQQKKNQKAEERQTMVRQADAMAENAMEANESLESPFVHAQLAAPVNVGQPRIVARPVAVRAARLLARARIRVRSTKTAQLVETKNKTKTKARGKVAGIKSVLRAKNTRAPVRAILFDLDGVLSDSEELHWKTFNQVFAPFGVQIPRAYWYSNYTGRGSRFIVADLIEKNGLQADAGRLLRQRFALFAKEVQAGHLKPIAAGVELAKWARKNGLKIAVASGGHKAHVRSQLQALGLGDVPFVAMEDVKNLKPDPEVFLKAAGRIGVKPSECLVLEDAAGGLRAARAAGMRCVLVGAHHPVSIRQKASRWMARLNAKAVVRYL